MATHLRVEIDHPDGSGTRCVVPADDPRANDKSLNPGEVFDPNITSEAPGEKPLRGRKPRGGSSDKDEG